MSRSPELVQLTCVGHWTQNHSLSWWSFIPTIQLAFQRTGNEIEPILGFWLCRFRVKQLFCWSWHNRHNLFPDRLTVISEEQKTDLCCTSRLAQDLSSNFNKPRCNHLLRPSHIQNYSRQLSTNCFYPGHEFLDVWRKIPNHESMSGILFAMPRDLLITKKSHIQGVRIVVECWISEKPRRHEHDVFVSWCAHVFAFVISYRAQNDLDFEQGGLKPRHRKCHTPDISDFFFKFHWVASLDTALVEAG